jgi:hypothetical protein
MYLVTVFDRDVITRKPVHGIAAAKATANHLANFHRATATVRKAGESKPVYTARPNVGDAGIGRGGFFGSDTMAMIRGSTHTATLGSSGYRVGGSGAEERWAEEQERKAIERMRSKRNPHGGRMSTAGWGTVPAAPRVPGHSWQARFPGARAEWRLMDGRGSPTGWTVEQSSESAPCVVHGPGGFRAEASLPYNARSIVAERVVKANPRPAKRNPVSVAFAPYARGIDVVVNGRVVEKWATRGQLEPRALATLETMGVPAADAHRLIRRALAQLREKESAQAAAEEAARWAAFDRAHRVGLYGARLNPVSVSVRRGRADKTSLAKRALSRNRNPSRVAVAPDWPGSAIYALERAARQYAQEMAGDWPDPDDIMDRVIDALLPELDGVEGAPASWQARRDAGQLEAEARAAIRAYYREVPTVGRRANPARGTRKISRRGRA